jgi:chromosome segregation ATPase
MKRTLLSVLLLAVAASGWVMFAYQQQKMADMAQSIEASVLQQVEYRRQAEAALKEKLESKKKAEQFMVQREYERELEGALSKQLREIEKLCASLDKDQEELFTRQTQTEEEAGVLRDRLEKLGTDVAALRRMWQESTAQAGRVQEQLAAEQKKTVSLQAQLDSMRKELKDLRTQAAAPQAAAPKGGENAI